MSRRGRLAVARLAAALVAGAGGVAGAGALAEAPPCPARFAQATGACDERVSPPGRACVFPQGKCTCARTTPCSGVPLPPDPPRWRCELARTDGCPNAAPKQGTACTKRGKSCTYGSCGAITYTCRKDQRTWFVSGVVAPPPSAAKAASNAPPDWKACQAGLRFGCEPRSQGIAPARGEEVPRVCGCVPTCPPALQVLISLEAEGTWPDGSRKGTFSCASQGIPSAAPPRSDF